MARQIWDPRKVLGLSFRDDRSLYCVGRAVSQWNSRCRYKLPEVELAQVLAIINNMGTFPPNEAHVALPRLAKLCLCPRYHQDQKTEVMVMWKKKIARAQKEYEEGKQLRTDNLRLLGKLAEERHERERLQEIVDGEDDSDSDDEIQEELAQELEDLKSRLIMALHEAARYQQDFLQAEESNTSLKSQNEFLEVMYDQRVRESEQLEIILADTNRKFSVEMEAEREQMDEYREVLEQGKLAFQELQDSQSDLVAALQMDIADKIVMLQQHQEAVRSKAAKNLTLVQQIDGISEKLDAESHKRKRMQEDLDKIDSAEYNLIAKVGVLEAKLAAERRKIERLERAADSAERARSELEEQYETLRAQAQQERENLSRAHEQLEEEVKQHARLTVDLQSLRRTSLTSDAQRLTELEDSLERYFQQNEALSKQRDSLQSHLTLERNASTRVRGDLAAATSMQSMLVEEIQLLRQQLEANEQAKADQDEVIRVLQEGKLGLRAQMDTQVIINEKLDDILTDTKIKAKEDEVRFKTLLDGAQASLRHTQQNLASCAMRNEHLLAANALKDQQIAALQRDISHFKYLVVLRNQTVAAAQHTGKFFSHAWQALMRWRRGTAPADDPTSMV